MSNQLDSLETIIHESQKRFAELLDIKLKGQPIDLIAYQKYLSMQYHLTKGVHRYFFTAAAHEDMFRLKPLRKFLIQFANEEERHYVVAANDLFHMGLDILPEPFEVRLWHSYFSSIVEKRPFLRIGAATILENISAGQAKPFVKQALSAPFLNAQNTKFLVIHQHEILPHGEQILAILNGSNLQDQHIQDLCTGAAQGLILYLRMAEWALSDNTIFTWADEKKQIMNEQDVIEIKNFEISELLT